jgi:superfamily I DNA/RNA helicase
MLNEQQLLAVRTTNASALILSGAGTGKSSVLVARINKIEVRENHPETSVIYVVRYIPCHLL